MPRWALCISLLFVSASVGAADLRVAVASNFLLPLEAVVKAYVADGGEPVQISAGATGHHYAQITNGAPYDVFLAADQARPQRLIDAGLAAADSRFTYALGRLVLWSNTAAQLPAEGLLGLAKRSPRRLAIANPRLAPYGRAAREALVATRQWQALKAVVVQAQNVGQAFQYAVTGNVSHALVAASYVHAKANHPGEWIMVDRRWHGPIRQDAVRLTNAPNPAKAKAFMTYLRSPAAAQVLKGFGYDTAVPAP